jgi:hopanoid biosynthesis associated RND transporter like protein HpnN
VHDAFEARLGPWLARCADLCRRRALWVLFTSLALAAVSLVYTVRDLGIRGDTEYLLSQELPFKQSERRYQEAFPLLYENIFVVIDAVTPERAGAAASALAERMQDRPDAFRSAYLPGGGDFFEQHAFLYLDREELEELADRLAQVQPYLAELSRDGTLRGLASMLGRGVRAVRDGEVSPENLEPILEGFEQAIEARLAGRPYHLSWAEMLEPGPIEGNPRRRFLLVQPVLDVTDFQPAKGAIQEIRRLAGNLGLTPENGVQVRITGDVALSYEEIGLVKSQAAASALGSLALVAVVLAVGLRSLRMIAAVLATLLVGLALNLGFTTLAVGHLNMISAAFAVLFIGLGVELEIHFAMRYQEALARGRSHATALYETAGDVGSSLFLTAVATAIGFFSFIPTDFVGVGELGLISGAGILIGFACTMTLLPALLSLGPPRAPNGTPRSFAWTTQRLADLPVRYPRAVRWAALALAVGTVFVLPRVRFDNNPLNVRDPSAESVQTFQDLLAGSTTSPWTVNAVAPDVASADALAERLRQLDVVGRVVTLADFIPQDQEEKLGIIEDVAMFLAPVPGPDGRVPAPTPGEQVAALATLEVEISRLLADGKAGELGPAAARLRDGLHRYRESLSPAHAEASLAALQDGLLGALPEQLRILSRALEAGEVTLENLPEALVERMLAADGRVRLEVFPKEDVADHAALAAFVDGVREVVPEVAGSAAEILESGRAVERALSQALLTALGAMTLALLIVWRRVVDTALVLAPLLLAAAFTVEAAVLLEIPFNFADVIVMPLLIGIGVDAAIHMVHRARAMGGLGTNLLTTSTARAIAYGSATNIASFGTMGLASHLGLATMGQLLVVGVLLTLLCNLVVLPALLDLRHRPAAGAGRRRHRPRPAEAPPARRSAGFGG